MPFVSVVVPTRNRPDYLVDALASVRAQTFLGYEIIVVSNGEDEVMRVLSRDVANHYGARYFALDKGNLPAARNFAIGKAMGEWIAFLDDDDAWLPWKLERQLKEFVRTGADMIVCDCIKFWPDGREEIAGVRLRRGWTYAKATAHLRWGAPPSAVMVRKSVILEAGGFDENQRYCEDSDLWRRISWRHQIHQMEEPLTRYRKHVSSMTHDWPRISFYDLRHIAKMWRDTPRDLRRTIPWPTTILRRWLMRALMPNWMRQPRKYLAGYFRQTTG